MTLRATDLWFRYERSGPWVLAGASLEVGPGEVVGLQGPSGCGKSTLGRVLAGLLPAERGRVDAGADPTPSGTRPVQVVLQHAEAAMDPRWTIGAVLAEAGADRATFDAITPALVEPAWHDRHPHELSGGELQRVNLARALLARPRHLIADEITASLDPLTQAAIWRFALAHCRRHGIGLLVISHDEPLLAAICDRTVPFAELARAGAQPERSSARNDATVSASWGALSGRYRLTRAKRRATPPG